jgi:hypothetical protein
LWSLYFRPMAHDSQGDGGQASDVETIAAVIGAHPVERQESRPCQRALRVCFDKRWRQASKRIVFRPPILGDLRRRIECLLRVTSLNRQLTAGKKGSSAYSLCYGARVLGQTASVLMASPRLCVSEVAAPSWRDTFFGQEAAMSATLRGSAKDPADATFRTRR